METKSFVQLDSREIGILEFIHDRLIHVYGENKDTDYLIHFRKITRELERNIEVSK